MSASNIPASQPGAPAANAPGHSTGYSTGHSTGHSTGYYKHHIFFCLNQRDGESACDQHGAKAAFDHCKARVKADGLAGPGGVRVNKAGCLDRCAGGPVAVVYPEGVWYTYVDQADLDEIIDSHLRDGQVVERLVLPASVGR